MPNLPRKPFGRRGRVHQITPESAGWRYVGFSDILSALPYLTARSAGRKCPHRSFILAIGHTPQPPPSLSSHPARHSSFRGKDPQTRSANPRLTRFPSLIPVLHSIRPESV